MDINEMFSLVARRWKVIVASVILAVLGAVALSILATPQYQSSAGLFVTTQAGATRDPYALSLLAGQRVKSYAELATSQQVLSAVAKRADVKDDVEDLRDKIDVTAVPETVVIRVTSTDDTAKGAQTLTKAASTEVSRYLSALEKDGKSKTGLEVRVSDPASLPESQSSPRTTLNMAVAGLLGLLIGLAMAILVDRRTARTERVEAPLDDGGAAGAEEEVSAEGAERGSPTADEGRVPATAGK